ncbi:MAG: hypothetical protein PHI97_09855 [Desulfobulbus sp.]|nr:hypothetical protein [Desulfobulbus sp.]
MENMENNGEQTNKIAKEVMVELLKKEARSSFEKELRIAGIANDYALEDALSRVSFEVIEYRGENRAIIRNQNGEIVRSEKLIEKLKENLPSYFKSGGLDADNANDSTKEETMPLSEHHVIDILQGIENGQILNLNDNQKKSLRKAFKELQKIDYTPGAIQKRKIGKYSAIDIHRLSRSVGAYQ